MKNKLSIESCDDGFVNLFEEWLFIKSFEYSALLINDIFWYKLLPNIDKKTWFVYIEIAFPLSTKNDVKELLSVKNYKTRFYIKEEKYMYWEYPIQQDKNKLQNLKNELLKF